MYAGFGAVTVANVVIVGYVIMVRTAAFTIEF
jgi:hypothetical protein